MGRITILLTMLLALAGGAVDKAAAEVMAETSDRHMLVARYYAGRGDYPGAINRFKIVVVGDQWSEHVEEALAGLSEAYLAIGFPSEAQTAVAVLLRKFPGGYWTAQAYAALTSAGLVPAENLSSWISRAFP